MRRDAHDIAVQAALAQKKALVFASIDKGDGARRVRFRTTCFYNFYRLHQTHAAHFSNDGEFRSIFIKLLRHPRPLNSAVSGQVVRFHILNGGQCCRHGDRIAAEC